MGSVNCENSSPEDVLRDAIAGGITLFQFREKGPRALEGTAKLELGRRLFRICHEHGIPFIVNDDVELMLALNADGLHIGQEDGSARAMRNRIGDKILGISAHNLSEARAALADGADYLGVGPMYETQTKPDIREVRGPEVIREIRGAGIACPIVGIGGITHGKAAPVIDAGADGVAVITAITQASAPLEAARNLRNEVRSR
ncbi:thiamine phosphate synthase [Brevibacillus fluminis]|nr:thiamine phosphate synthase [Brevibacillus fluminis]